MEFGVVRKTNSLPTLSESASRIRSRATSPLHSCPRAVHFGAIQHGHVVLRPTRGPSGSIPTFPNWPRKRAGGKKFDQSLETFQALPTGHDGDETPGE